MRLMMGDVIVAENLKIANTFYLRLMGLMFSNSMENFDALLLTPGNSIHTFFMKYKIDVVFLNRDMKIIKIIREMSPWRMTRVYFKASQCLEFYGGAFPLGIKEGDSLEVVCIN